MKVVYFDVENYEKYFLKVNTENKYDYFLENDTLNEIMEIKEDYLDSDVISVFTTSRLTKNVLEKFKNLKLIALRSVGFNHVDIEYCKKRNIKVVNSPNYGNITVAEFALALLLDVARKVTKSYGEFKYGCVAPEKLIGVELANKTVGIIGLGSIGSNFAKICYGLSMNILGFDKYENEELKEKYNIKYVDFDTLLKKSDFISIHAPLTKDSFHMFNEESFSKMKKSAILINTGRGELIDTKALYNAILNKEIAGVGLDVLEKEETVTDFDYVIGINRLDKSTLEKTIINTQLFKFDNVIMTPHVAYNSREAIERILKITISNIDEFILGNLTNSVY